MPETVITCTGQAVYDRILDRDYVVPLQADFNIADPTDPDNLHPASSDGARGQTSITTGTVALLFKAHAIPSFEATPPIKIFRTTITRFLLFCERFQKADAQVTGFEVLSHF